MSISDPRPFQDPLMQEIALRSEVNGRDYGLRIRLPQSYGQGDGRYPVMLVLDAEMTFYLASEIVSLEAAWSRVPLGSEPQPLPVPEVIVVSVALPSDPPDPFRRNFEYSPPSSEEDFTASSWAFIEGAGTMMGRAMEFGGAANFLDVLRDEILPAIEAHYRTDASRRVLVGLSASGCFAAFTLLTEPHLFSDYIIISPSLPACIFRREAAWASANDDLPARVLLTAGALEARDPLSIVSGVVRLAEELGHRRYPRLRLDTWIVPEATHVQTAGPSIARGLGALARA